MISNKPAAKPPSKAAPKPAPKPVAKLSTLNVDPIRKILSSVPLKPSRAPLSWLAMELLELTRSSEANLVGKVYDFDSGAKGLANLLHCVPINRNEDEIFGDGWVTDDKTKAEWESQTLLLEFIATLAFALTTGSQVDNIVNRTKAIFDKPEYGYVIGLMFAHAHRGPAVMGLLSRFVGFGSKSPQLVGSLFSYGITAVLKTFRRIQTVSKAEAREFVTQLDTLISQVRIVVKAASIDGFDAMLKSGLLPAIKAREADLRECVTACFSGAHLSISVSSSMMQLIATIVEALSPVTSETKFIEHIVTEEHLKYLTNSFHVLKLVTTVPFPSDDVTKVVTNQWGEFLLRIFTGHKQSILPDGGATTKEKEKKGLFSGLMKSKKPADQPCTKAQTGPIQVRTPLKWGRITPLALSLTELTKVLCCAKSKVWTKLIAGDEWVALLALLAGRISSDLISNSIVTSIYNIFNSSDPEILTKNGMIKFCLYLLGCLAPTAQIVLRSTALEEQDKHKDIVHQARMVRLLALLKDIKSPSSLLKDYLAEVIAQANGVDQIIPSWQEVGKIEGVSTAKIHEPEYEGGGKPKAQTPSKQPEAQTPSRSNPAVNLQKSAPPAAGAPAQAVRNSAAAVPTPIAQVPAETLKLLATLVAKASLKGWDERDSDCVNAATAMKQFGAALNREIDFRELGPFSAAPVLSLPMFHQRVAGLRQHEQQIFQLEQQGAPKEYVNEMRSKGKAEEEFLLDQEAKLKQLQMIQEARQQEALRNQNAANTIQQGHSAGYFPNQQEPSLQQQQQMQLMQQQGPPMQQGPYAGNFNPNQQQQLVGAQMQQGHSGGSLDSPQQMPQQQMQPSQQQQMMMQQQQYAASQMQQVHSAGLLSSQQQPMLQQQMNTAIAAGLMSSQQPMIQQQQLNTGAQMQSGHSAGLLSSHQPMLQQQPNTGVGMQPGHSPVHILASQQLQQIQMQHRPDELRSGNLMMNQRPLNQSGGGGQLPSPRQHMLMQQQPLSMAPMGLQAQQQYSNSTMYQSQMPNFDLQKP